MAEFNLADVLRDVNAQDLGHAGREQISYIDIDLIDPDPANFYELSDLDELAANIELVGLQQPLRVRVHPEDPERWMIVSGHRRRAAIRQLVDDGKDELRAVACIVEQPAASKELQELRLIYANSGTRKMTPAEISKQAERVEMLLYQLKEQGVEFGGRMRDHVAEACKVSKSKLARLKVIRENLSSTIKPFFDSGKLAESTAYALAQHPKSWQCIIWGSKYNKEQDGTYLREWYVKDGVKILEDLTPLKCVDGAGCANLERMFSRSMTSNCYNPCRGCCKDCGRKLECGSVCAIVKPSVKAAKEEKKKEEAAEKEREEQAKKERYQSTWDAWKRLGDIAKERGSSVDEVARVLTGERQWDYGNARSALLGEEGAKSRYRKPFADYEGHDHLLAVADLLHCSTDYLLGRTDAPQPPAATTESEPVWRDPAKGQLPKDGATVIGMLQYDKPYGKWSLEYLDYIDGKWLNYGFTVPNDVRILWQPEYNPDLDVSDSGTEGEEET